MDLRLKLRVCLVLKPLHCIAAQHILRNVLMNEFSRGCSYFTKGLSPEKNASPERMHLTVAPWALWLGLGAEMSQRGVCGPSAHSSWEAAVWQAGVGTPSIPGGHFQVGCHDRRVMTRCLSCGPGTNGSREIAFPVAAVFIATSLQALVPHSPSLREMGIYSKSRRHSSILEWSARGVLNI